MIKILTWPGNFISFSNSFKILYGEKFAYKFRMIQVYEDGFLFDAIT